MTSNGAEPVSEIDLLSQCSKVQARDLLLSRCCWDPSPPSCCRRDYCCMQSNFRACTVRLSFQWATYILNGSRAREALSLLLVPPKAGNNTAAPTRAIEFFDQMEIYPGKQHLVQVTGRWSGQSRLKTCTFPQVARKYRNTILGDGMKLTLF